MKRAFLAGLAVLLLVSATAGAEKAPDKPYRWFVFPIAGFDTDDGLGFGGRVEVQRIAEGYDPYRASVVIQAPDLISVLS